MLPQEGSSAGTEMSSVMPSTTLRAHVPLRLIFMDGSVTGSMPLNASPMFWELTVMARKMQNAARRILFIIISFLQAWRK